jgi:hypothetical protein
MLRGLFISLFASLLVQSADVYKGMNDPVYGPAMRPAFLYGGLFFIVLGAVALVAGIVRWRERRPALRSIMTGVVVILFGGASVLFYYLTAPIPLEIA